MTARMAMTLVLSKTDVKNGEEFFLSLWAQDLRPDSEEGGRRYLRGVYAAYADVNYRKDLCVRIPVPPVFHPQYQNNYPNYPACADGPRGMKQVGAFYSGQFEQYVLDPVEVVRIGMRAQLAPTVSPGVTVIVQAFRLDFSKLLYPVHASLLMGNSWAAVPDHGVVSPSEIAARGCELTIRR